MLKTLNRFSLTEIFIVTGGIFFSLFLGFYVLDRNLYTVIFHSDFEDVFMDFFNSVSHAMGRIPYSIQAIYPPLCYVLYWIMGKLMGDTAVQVLGNHEISQKAVRSMAQPMMIFLVYFSVSLIVFLFIGCRMLQKKKTESIVFFSLICFSSPFLFQFERANIIFISLLGAMMFFCWKDSPNKYLRELALISLAFSAALKIYPAVFGFILLKEKRYKEAFRLVLYGIICFFLPFLFIRGGFFNILQFIKNLIYTSTIDQAQTDGYKLSYSAVLDYILRSISGDAVFTKVTGEKFSLLFPAFGAFAFPWIKEKWKEALLLTVLLIGVPHMSYTYTAIFMVIPLILFLQIENKKALDGVYLLLFLLVFFPLPFLGWNDHNGIAAYHIFNRSYNTLQISFSVLGLSVLTIGEGIYSFIKKDNKGTVLRTFGIILALLSLTALCCVGVKGTYKDALQEQEKVTKVTEGKLENIDINFNDRWYKGMYHGEVKNLKPCGKGTVKLDGKYGNLVIEGIWDNTVVNGNVKVIYSDNSYSMMHCRDSKIYGYVTTYKKDGKIVNREWIFNKKSLIDIEKTAIEASYNEIQNIYILNPNALFKCTGKVNKILQEYSSVKVYLNAGGSQKYLFRYNNIGIHPGNYVYSPNLSENDTVTCYGYFSQVSDDNFPEFNMISAYIEKNGAIETADLDGSYKDFTRYPNEYIDREISVTGIIEDIYYDFDRNLITYFVKNQDSRKECYAVTISIKELLPRNYSLTENDKKKIMNKTASGYPNIGEIFSITGIYNGNYSYHSDLEKDEITVLPWILLR